VPAVAALTLAALAACESPPPLKINYDLSKGPSQMCPVENCAGVLVACDTVLSIRIVDPAQQLDVDAPAQDNALLSVCQHIDSPSLCGMHQVHLPSDAELPARRLAIQVALYNADDIPRNGEGELQCPTTLRFDANNLAIAGEPHPAVAGQGYFSPGDAETVVKLGCNDLTLINTPTCRGTNRLKVTASVDDFDTGVVLQPPLAKNVALLVGEPSSFDNGSGEQHRLPYSQLTQLQLLADSVPPAWSGELDEGFVQSVCVVVEEKTPQSTSSITCRLDSKESPLDLRGLRLARDTLDDVLAALQLSAFPTKGLVVGMVVDGLGKPVKDVQVRPSSGTVKYLSEGRDRISGTSTSSSGIFLSQDTPYQTSWSAPGTTGGYGGLVADHVTMVLLQPDAQTQARARAAAGKAPAPTSATAARSSSPPLTLQLGQ
jgi:hypothetical protein